jgi:hypothetical protein
VRYKGQITSRQIDRDYPYQVEIAIPEGGLGTRLNAMHEFCRGADFQTRGVGEKRLRTGRDGVRFCFKTPDLAEAFQARFEGERITYCRERRGGNNPVGDVGAARTRRPESP